MFTILILILHLPPPPPPPLLSPSPATNTSSLFIVQLMSLMFVIKIALRSTSLGSTSLTMVCLFVLLFRFPKQNDPLCHKVSLPSLKFIRQPAASQLETTQRTSDDDGHSSGHRQAELACFVVE